MRRESTFATVSLMILAVLGVMAALYLLKSILVPIAMALVLACLLSPITRLLRRMLPLSSTGAAVMLFVLTALIGLYAASLTAESLIMAANTLPSDIERFAGQISQRVTDISRDKPYLRGILPEPGTIDELGDANRAMLYNSLNYVLDDLTGWVAQGLIILILVLFLLAESEMLTPKLVRFFATTPKDAQLAQRELRNLTRQVRNYLGARTIINIGMGAVIALALWLLNVKFAVALGAFAAITNYIPYVGQVIGGTLPALVALGTTGSLGDALIVAAVYLAVVTIEGYVVTPWVMGRSLDLNGTTVLIACLIWGFLWGLMGLVLAMPITVSMKLIFQNVPELHRWAELMSRDWHPPDDDSADEPSGLGGSNGVSLPTEPASGGSGPVRGHPESAPPLGTNPSRH